MQNHRIQNIELGTQKSIVTIQGTVQEAIRKITGENTKVIAGSRTDAGVHAIGQVASFKTVSHLENDILKRALNANLPPDIRITDVSETDEDFHPRYDAKKKIYSYLLSFSRPDSVFLRRYTWQIHHDPSLLLDVMREAAGYITGENDFSCFRASGCASRNSVRVIYNINISECSSFDFLTFRLDVKLFKITIEANAFLRHMARNIVGTLVDIARGRFKPSYMKELLISKDRKLAGITAPPCGLFLESIYYGD